MLIALAQKHPTITSATDLTVHTIITNDVEPPSGTTYLQLRTNEVRLGITLYAFISSTRTSFWALVDITQGLEVNAGLTVGYNSPIVAIFTVDAANGNVMTFGTIECYNGITTYGHITRNALTATNIYTKTETDNLLAVKATVTHVDGRTRP